MQMYRESKKILKIFIIIIHAYISTFFDGFFFKGLFHKNKILLPVTKNIYRHSALGFMSYIIKTKFTYKLSYYMCLIINDYNKFYIIRYKNYIKNGRQTIFFV
jgi:hypothetical protein